MAKLGTVFVELQLDDKIYKQKLAEIQPGAQATAKGVETAWRALGTKSSEYFDQQRKAAENAYNLIKTSATTSAQDIIRAEQAKNETIERLNTQQFGKQTSLISNLKEHWLAATAAITAAYMTAQKAWNLADQAARYEQSAQAFHSMATSMGKDATTEFEKIRKASGGLIDDQALTEAANKAMSLGIPIEKIGDLMLIARAKARDMGTDASQAFSDIATGVGRASPLILDNLGLVMKVGSANEAMAASLGKTVAELTDQEKKTAILNATLDAGKEALARYDLEQMTTAENMQAFKATMANLQLILGQGIVRAAAAVVGSFQSLSAASMTVSSGIWKIIEGKERLAAMVTWGDAEKRHMELAKEAAQNAQSDFKSSIEYATKAQNNFKLMIASTESLSNATKTGGRVAVEAEKAKTDAIEDTSKAAKKSAEDQIKNEAKIADAAHKRGQEIIDTYYAERKAAENYYDKLEEESERAQAKRAEDARRKGQEIIDSYYSEKQKADSFYNSLNTKAKESGEQRIAVEVDVFGRMSELEKQKLLAAGTFFDGVKMGYDEIQSEAITFGEAGYRAIWDFANSSKTAVSDILFQSIKNGTVDAKAVWDTFSSSMLKTFTDTIAEMVTQAAMKDIALMFTASWTAESSSVLGIIDKLTGLVGNLFGSSSSGTATTSSWIPEPGEYFASGGRYPSDRPFWVGEKGPEIIIPDGSSGIVLSNQQSKAYSAMNGGYIPGYANGTLGPGDFTDPQAYQKYITGINAWRNVPYPTGLTPAQTASYNAYRYGMGDTYAKMPFTFGTEFPAGFTGIRIAPDGSVYWNVPQGDGGSWFNKFMTGATPAIIAAVGTAYGGPVFGAGLYSTMQGKSGLQIALSTIAAYLASAAGEYIGELGNAPAGAQWEGAGGGFAGVDWSDVPNMAIGAGKQALANLVKSYLQGIVSGDGLRGSANVTFEGFGGDLDWLAGLMGKIAPRSDRFAFHARNGLDYVPYDNFPAVLHKGERVQTAKEARNGDGASLPPIQLNLNVDGRTLASLLYKQSKAGVKVIHERGITNV